MGGGIGGVGGGAGGFCANATIPIMQFTRTKWNFCSFILFELVSFLDGENKTGCRK